MSNEIRVKKEDVLKAYSEICFLPNKRLGNKEGVENVVEIYKIMQKYFHEAFEEEKKEPEESELRGIFNGLLLKCNAQGVLLTMDDEVNKAIIKTKALTIKKVDECTTYDYISSSLINKNDAKRRLGRM